MQIYANLFKINEKCYCSVISWPILILFVLSDRAWCRLQNFYTEFWNSLIMQIYANLFKINEKCYFSVISWSIMILFVLSDRAWCGLQNFYTEFWNSLIMQIYSKSMKNATSPLFRNHNRSALEAGTYITHRVNYYSLVFICIYFYFDRARSPRSQAQPPTDCSQPGWSQSHTMMIPGWSSHHRTLSAHSSLMQQQGQYECKILS